MSPETQVLLSFMGLSPRSVSARGLRFHPAAAVSAVLPKAQRYSLAGMDSSSSPLQITNDQNTVVQITWRIKSEG